MAAGDVSEQLMIGESSPEELALYRQRAMLRKLKKQPAPECKLIMTSMIDIVFLLIIFLILVTDLSQMEIEALALPFAVSAEEDDPTEERVIVNITDRGQIRMWRQNLSEDELFARLKAKADTSRRDADGLPTLKVKIRADLNTEYKHIQVVMVKCMRAYIWRLSFGAQPVPEEVLQQRF